MIFIALQVLDHSTGHLSNPEMTCKNGPQRMLQALSRLQYDLSVRNDPISKHPGHFQISGDEAMEEGGLQAELNMGMKA